MFCPQLYGGSPAGRGAGDAGWQTVSENKESKLVWDGRDDLTQLSNLLLFHCFHSKSTATEYNFDRGRKREEDTFGCLHTTSEYTYFPSSCPPNLPTPLPSNWPAVVKMGGKCIASNGSWVSVQTQWNIFSKVWFLCEDDFLKMKCGLASNFFLICHIVTKKTMFRSPCAMSPTQCPTTWPAVTKMRGKLIVSAPSPNPRLPDWCRLPIGRQALISSTVPEHNHHLLINKQHDWTWQRRKGTGKGRRQASP